jgi:hypothetical protein
MFDIFSLYAYPYHIWLPLIRFGTITHAFFYLQAGKAEFDTMRRYIDEQAAG